MADTNYKDYLNQLEKNLDLYFIKKAPALPTNAKEIIVKIAPYLTILSVLFTLPAIFALVGLGSLNTMIAPMGGSVYTSSLPHMWISIILLIPVVVLEAMAIPGLFARTATAWRYMYWAQLISIVSSLIQLNIVGAILSALIGFYLLFQVKNYYK